VEAIVCLFASANTRINQIRPDPVDRHWNSRTVVFPYLGRIREGDIRAKHQFTWLGGCDMHNRKFKTFTRRMCVKRVTIINQTSLPLRGWHDILKYCSSNIQLAIQKYSPDYQTSTSSKPLQSDIQNCLVNHLLWPTYTFFGLLQVLDSSTQGRPLGRGSAGPSPQDLRSHHSWTGPAFIDSIKKKSNWWAKKKCPYHFFFRVKLLNGTQQSVIYSIYIL